MTNSTKCYDVAVVGAGIAGSCAAIALAKRGLEVVLLEAGEFPRHKVCGEFLSPESRAIFERLGVLGEIRQAGALPVHQTRVVVGAAAVGLELPTEGLSLSRYRLDQILWHGTQAAGVHGHTGVRVHGTHRWNEDGWVIEADESNFHAKNLLVATGRHSNWLDRHAAPGTKTTEYPSRKYPSRPRYFGMKAHFAGVQLKAGTVELHPFKGGYCGLVHIEDGLTNVCLLARYDILQKRSPQAFWQQLIRDNRSLANRFIHADPCMEWLTTGNLTFTAPQPFTHQALRCGDAAGFIAPLAGDGMAMAARSGELAAAVLAARTRGALRATEATQVYMAAWQREFGKRLRWAAALQMLMTAPSLTAPGFALFSRLPALTRLALKNTRSA